MYTVRRRLIGKLVVDFLFVLIELFRQVLRLRRYIRANIDWKSAFLKVVGQFWPNFHIVWDVPRDPLLHGLIGQ